MRDDLIARVRGLAAARPGLELLVLYGSRARGDVRPGSDWDFGYLAGAGFDPDGLLADLVLALEADAVDLVDLARASGQLRYRAAADARVIFEPVPGTFDGFWFEAVSYWCDMQDIIRREYDAALARLPA